MLSKVKYLLAAFVLLVVVMFALPFFSVADYSIIKNTTSQLGAQHAPLAWIMNLTFLFLGIASIWSGWKKYSGFVFHRVALLGFGISLMMAALFRHKPIAEGIAYNVRADSWHSLFASTTGFFFTLLAISTAFICQRLKDRVLAIAIATTATGLSLLMFTLEDQMGIWQRLIFLSSFGWMTYVFASVEFK